MVTSVLRIILKHLCSKPKASLLNIEVGLKLHLINDCFDLRHNLLLRSDLYVQLKFAQLVELKSAWALFSRYFHLWLMASGINVIKMLSVIYGFS
jgi:hypothetical protein